MLRDLQRVLLELVRDDDLLRPRPVDDLTLVLREAPLPADLDLAGRALLAAAERRVLPVIAIATSCNTVTDWL